MKTKELFKLYKNSYYFNSKIRSDKTRKNYYDYIKTFLERFGNYTITQISKDKFVYEMRVFLEQFHPTPRKCQYLLTSVKSMFKWGENQRIIKHNMMRYIQYKPPEKNPSLQWTNSLVEYAIHNFPKPLKDYVIFATETGLRRCDLIRLKIDHIIDNTHLIINQSKTLKKVKIKITHILRDHMNSMELKEYLLTSSNGMPWTEWKFGSAWSRQRTKAKNNGIILPPPHNFRKVMARNLLSSGASIAQTSDVLGINANTLQKYYFERGTVADIAIDKLNHNRRPKGVLDWIKNKLFS